MEQSRPLAPVLPKRPLGGIGLKLGLRLYLLLMAIILPALFVYYIHNFKTIEKLHDQEVRDTVRMVAIRLEDWMTVVSGKEIVEADREALVRELKRIVDAPNGLDSISVFVVSPSKGLEHVGNYGANAPANPTEDDQRAAVDRNDRTIEVQRGARQFLAVSVPLIDKGEVKALAHIQLVPDAIGLGRRLPELRSQLVIGAGAMLLVVGLGVAFFFQFAVGQHVQKLVVAMERAAEGDMTALVVAGSGELGWLAGSYNTMMRRLKMSIDENQRLIDQIKGFNAELQGKVDVATRELVAANDRLFAIQRQMTTQEKLATLGHVATTIAHELGTPLNAISGHLQLMLEGDTHDAKTRDRLQVINSQVDRLTGIVREVLKSMRLPPPRCETISLNHVIEDVVDLVTPTARKANIVLEPKLNRELPLISADSDQLEQVLMNLFTNAMDAMPKGGRLTLATSFVTSQAASPGVTLAEGNYLRLDVTDTGQGMDDATVRRIFQPFFSTKADGESVGVNSGVGLGLAICRLIITNHHGEISVHSEKGNGTTLSVFLPVERERVMNLS